MPFDIAMKINTSLNRGNMFKKLFLSNKIDSAISQKYSSGKRQLQSTTL
jgi:hypothetical protein